MRKLLKKSLRVWVGRHRQLMRRGRMSSSGNASGSMSNSILELLRVVMCLLG
jgi:hypothetical protein